MRYYHGTSDIIQFEDNTIKSALDTGILRESWRTKLLDKVFMTTSLVSAARYARKASNTFGGNPVIYVVEPIGYCDNTLVNEYIADEAKIIERIEVTQLCHLFLLGKLLGNDWIHYELFIFFPIG